jgi:hypothetical protein
MYYALLYPSGGHPRRRGQQEIFPTVNPSMAKIIFHKLVLNSEALGSDEEHLVSRVYFSLQLDDHTVRDLYADFTQPAKGESLADSFQIGPPMGYSGPFNQGAFQELVKTYYNSIIGEHGSALAVRGEGKLRIRNSTFSQEARYEVEFN